MMNIERFIFALLYRLKLYKAPLVGDGKTDNRRAVQARVDVDKVVFAEPGIYHIGTGVIYMKEGDRLISITLSSGTNGLANSCDSRETRGRAGR